MTAHAPNPPRHNTRRADCLTLPPQLWDDDASPEDQAEARSYCLECPVFAQCLESAMASEKKGLQRGSVKAGLDPAGRRWLARTGQRDGGYDAEEARLLALESVVTGRSMPEIAAREGVSGVTLELAVRILPKRQLPRIEQIQVYRRQGLGWAEIDKRMGKSARSTQDYVAQWRRDAVARGVEVPAELKPRRPLTDEQVVLIRELASRGVRRGVLCQKFSVAPRTIQDVVSGKSYRDVGGPRRSDWAVAA